MSPKKKQKFYNKGREYNSPDFSDPTDESPASAYPQEDNGAAGGGATARTTASEQQQPKNVLMSSPLSIHNIVPQSVSSEPDPVGYGEGHSSMEHENPLVSLRIPQPRLHLSTGAPIDFSNPSSLAQSSASFSSLHHYSSLGAVARDPAHREQHLPSDPSLISSPLSIHNFVSQIALPEPVRFGEEPRPSDPERALQRMRTHRPRIHSNPDQGMDLSCSPTATEIPAESATSFPMESYGAMEVGASRDQMAPGPDPSGSNLGLVVSGAESCPSSSRDQETSRQKKKKQQCRLCANHNIYVEMKGHKYFCPYTKCVCKNCGVTRMRQLYMKMQQQITRSQDQKMHMYRQQQQQPQHQQHESQPQPLPEGFAMPGPSGSAPSTSGAPAPGENIGRDYPTSRREEMERDLAELDADDGLIEEISRLCKSQRGKKR